MVWDAAGSLSGSNRVLWCSHEPDVSGYVAFVFVCWLGFRESLVGMRARIVDPAFFADEDVARLSPQAQLLFLGLLMFVDDYGNGYWLPKQIEGSVFPYTPVDIMALLGEVERGRFIARYTVRNSSCFKVWNFHDYQTGLRYRRQSSIPEPPANYDWEKDAPTIAPELVYDDKEATA